MGQRRETNRQPAEGFATAVCELVSQRAVEVFLQPIVDLVLGRIIGYEALARGPAESPYHSAPSLLRGAQMSGCREELERLCRVRALEVKANLLAPGELIFVNLDPRYASCLLATGCDTCDFAARLDVPHGEVVYELSEHVDLAANPSLLAAVEKCRRDGYLIALDDVGSGCSGLQAVLRVRPDFLKIDGSITMAVVHDAYARSIVRALVALGREISSRVIAEHVETPEQLLVLSECGVEYGQGFLLGRPAPVPVSLGPQATVTLRNVTRVLNRYK